MGLTKNIWKWLTSSAHKESRKGHPDLYPINVTELTKELNLIEEAKRLGEAGVPPADAQAITGPEAIIVQRVEKARQDYVDWAVTRLSVLNQNIGRRRRVAQNINRARQADKEFERKAGALLTEKESLLCRLGDIAKKRGAELEAFRAKHGLKREVNPPGEIAFFRYAILVSLIVFEGMVNASFFAQGISTGLVGGFIYAALLAAVNVVVAFMIGKLWIRYLNHCFLGWKFVGFISLIAAILIMIILGLGIAHVRDSLTSEVSDPALVALHTLMETPFQLHDFFSWLLFIVSIIFAIISLLDGLYSDDLYPGYGSISKRTRLAIDEYDDELSTLRTDLENIKDEELKNLDNAVNDSQADIIIFKSHIEDKRATGSRLSTALRDADNSLEALLRIFRTENELHRNTTPKPHYFEVFPLLRPIQMPDFDTNDEETNLIEQQKHVETLLAEVQELRAHIQEAFNQKFDQLKPLDTHFPNKALI